MSDTGRDLLRRRIELSGYSIAYVADQLGHDRTWLTKILNGDRQITLDHVESVLAVLRVPISQFLADLSCEIGEAPDPNLVVARTPGQLLKALLQTGEDSGDPVQLVERWRERQATPPASDAVFSIDPRAAEIDDLREHDANAALVEAEIWLDQLYGRHASRRLDASEAVRVATVLGIWASAARARGRVRDAAHALVEAFAFHGPATSSPTYADLLERTALVAKDFGFLQPAVDLLQEAHTLFALASMEARELRTMLALGIVHFYGGHFDLAEAAFERCLTYSGGGPIQKAGAVVNLVVIYEKQSRFHEADAVLERVEASVDRLPATWKGAILSARSRSLDRQGDLEGAKDILIEAIEAARGKTAACPQFLRFLDLADLLVRMGRRSELIAHASSHASLLAELDDTPVARQTALAFFNAIRTGAEITPREIAETTEQFKRAASCHKRS